MSVAVTGCGGPPSIETSKSPDGQTTAGARPNALSAELAEVLARRASSGAAVILDARTGAVLAATGDERAAPPGSSVKPLLVASALRAGVIGEDHQHTCAGTYTVAGASLRCFAEHGPVDVAHGLATSCNAFAFDVAAALGADAVAESFEALGFDVPDRARDEAPAVYAATVGTGHGGLTVTPRQLGAAYRTALLSADGASRWSDEASAAVRAGLVAAVELPGGTARSCAVDGLRVGAKTGTAGGDGDGGHDSWLVAVAPTEAPEIILVVHVTDGGTAPEAAAPAAGEMLRAWHARR